MKFRKNPSLDVALLHQAVSHFALETPTAPAIDDGERVVCYAELAERMDRVAAVLQAGGVERGDRVGILIDNGIAACEAILGILRADACYVHLNPTYPALRLANVIAEAGLDAVITVAANIALLDEVSSTTAAVSMILVIDSDLPGENETGPPAAAQNREEDLAYILFTSGTTGNPKGVMITHRNVKSTIGWGVRHFGIAADDRLSNHSRLSFDVSVFDIFCAFFAGATVCPLVSAGDIAFPGKFIVQRGITIWFSVPSVIAMLMKSGQLAAAPFTSLRAALFAGEALTPDMVEAWRANQPQTPIYNLYGPTEGTIVCTVFNIGVDAPFEADKPVPIGVETRDCELLILDPDSDRLAPPETIGRLMICGSQVSPGYWRRPELTAEAFRINPLKAELGARMYDTGDLAFRGADGFIRFVGRNDSQIKLHGYRIELGEIEVVLSTHSGISEAAAVLIDGDNPFIAAAITTAIEDIAEENIFQHLEERLPAHMVPSRLVFLDVMPRNDTGKIDRNRIIDEFVRG